jgi:hypothetical protein
VYSEVNCIGEERALQLLGEQSNTGHKVKWKVLTLITGSFIDINRSVLSKRRLDKVCLNER